MRFENIILSELDASSDDCSYLVEVTDELIEITNKIRERHGNTDFPDYDNDIYYTYYLCFNVNNKEITLNASVAHSENDDYKWYTIDLLPEEKEMLMWKVIKSLVVEQNEHTVIDELDIAKRLINDFCYNEYGSKADFSDLHSVGIAYTTLGDDESLDVQVYVDLIDFKVCKYVNDLLVVTEQYASLAALIDKQLRWLDFVQLACDIDDEILKVFNTPDYVSYTSLSDDDKQEIVIAVEAMRDYGDNDKLSLMNCILYNTIVRERAVRKH